MKHFKYILIFTLLLSSVSLFFILHERENISTFEYNNYQLTYDENIWEFEIQSDIYYPEGRIIVNNLKDKYSISIELKNEYDHFIDFPPKSYPISEFNKLPNSEIKLNEDIRFVCIDDELWISCEAYSTEESFEGDPLEWRGNIFGLEKSSISYSSNIDNGGDGSLNAKETQDILSFIKGIINAEKIL